MKRGPEHDEKGTSKRVRLGAIDALAPDLTKVLTECNTVSERVFTSLDVKGKEALRFTCKTIRSVLPDFRREIEKAISLQLQPYGFSLGFFRNYGHHAILRFIVDVAFPLFERFPLQRMDKGRYSLRRRSNLSGLLFLSVAGPRRVVPTHGQGGSPGSSDNQRRVMRSALLRVDGKFGRP